MTKKYVILPCNGLDKNAGCASREVALELAAQSDSEILCPVFYRVSDNKYNQLANTLPLLVIDGCGTRCASKLAAEKGLTISEKINISDIAKDNDIALSSKLAPKEDLSTLVKAALEQLTAEKEKADSAASIAFPEKLDYDEYKKDKFTFRLPKDEGFWFSENDLWLYVDGDIARVGITAYAEKSLMDIMFFTPPEINAKIEQFGEAGEVESSKAVFELVCPVSGTITAVNESLEDEPEKINENPYEQGWIFEIRLSDFKEDKELLLPFDEYIQIMKRKVDEFHV